MSSGDSKPGWTQSSGRYREASEAVGGARAMATAEGGVGGEAKWTVQRAAHTTSLNRRDRENYGQVWRPIGLDLSLNLAIGSGATVFQLSCKMGHIIAADIATTFQDLVRADGHRVCSRSETGPCLRPMRHFQSLTCPLNPNY